MASPISGPEPQEAFMRWALQQVLSTPSTYPHTLSFLVNKTTQNWYGRYGSRRGTLNRMNIIQPFKPAM
jgi:hypothetical protein